MLDYLLLFIPAAFLVISVLVAIKSFEKGKLLEKGDTFANIGATIADNFGLSIPRELLGKPILK